MSRELRHLIGQLMVCGFPSPDVDAHVHQLIREYHVGNIILFSRNIESLEQTRHLTQSLQQLAQETGQDNPLLICTDQENGLVSRFSKDVPGFPGNMALGATGDDKWAYRVGQMTGAFLALAGINMDLAPVLDVNNNPLNPVIGVRSFGDNPKSVAQMGVAMIRGLEESKVIACGKHFPGHGDTHVDSHTDLPRISHHLDRMKAVELLPFEQAIHQGLSAIMTAHIVFEQLDAEHPATLSPKVLQGLLRETLGFTGVVTTDCLEMQAILGTVGVGQGAVMALLAGADMIMVSHHLDLQIEAMDAIYDAVVKGQLPLSRLEEAYGRIERLKKALGESVHEPQDRLSLLQAKALDLQKDVAQHALTCLYDGSQSKTEPGVSRPFPKPRRVAVVFDTGAPQMIAAGPDAVQASLLQSIEAGILDSVEVRAFSINEALGDVEEVLRYDWLIYLSRTLGPIQEDLSPLFCAHPYAVVWLLRTPYLFPMFKEMGANRIYALYENTPWMIQAALGALLGQSAGGSLPVQVKDYPRGYQGCAS